LRRKAGESANVEQEEVERCRTHDIDGFRELFVYYEDNVYRRTTTDRRSVERSGWRDPVPDL